MKELLEIEFPGTLREFLEIVVRFRDLIDGIEEVFDDAIEEVLSLWKQNKRIWRRKT